MKPRQVPRCRDHDETMLLAVGDEYICLSCEAGKPPSNPRLKQVPVRRDYETSQDYEDAYADWRKRNYPSRKGTDF